MEDARMPGKPASFPAAPQAIENLPSQAQAHVPPDAFDFTTTAAAAAPDVSDPPATVLAEVDPQATIEFPDGAVEALTEHANRPAHVTDWFPI
jgi:hypothetical protein